MRMHTLMTKAASIAVCFGIMLSGPGSAFAGTSSSAVRNVELSADGTLYGRVFTSEGRAVDQAQIELRYQGTTIARTVSVKDGQFTITGVRGGVHEITVGSMSTPVRLWKNGTAPESASQGLIVSGSENVVRGQACDMYGNPIAGCPPTTSGFGLIDVVTLAMVGTSVAALVFAIDTNNELDDVNQKLDDLQAQLPVSP